MESIRVSDLPPEVKVIGSGGYDSETCLIKLSKLTLEALKSKKLELTLYRLPNSQKTIHNLSIEIHSIRGKIILRLGGDCNEVLFKEGSIGNYDILLWQDCQIIVGENTTANDIKIFCNNSSFSCGADCMFSDGVLVQCTDQHGIIDLKSGDIINNEYRKVTLGDHVWLARNTTLSANAKIGDGCVIGTGSVVVNQIPPKSIAAGVPASVIKKHHTWSRSQGSTDTYSEQYIKDYLSIEKQKNS